MRELTSDAALLADSTGGADKHDRESGYAGRMAQISFPGEAHGNTNYYVANGMGEYPEKLAAKLPHGVVHKGHRCTDVSRRADGKYLVQLIVREGDDYTPKSLTCDTLVLAAPPFALRSFSVAKELAPVLFAIQDRRNTHVYAKSSSPGVPDTSTTAERVYKGFPESLLQQFISGDYGNGIFQAGYACDRFERVWRELQFQGPEVVREQVQKQFARLDLPSSAANLKIDEVYLRAGWVHRWQARYSSTCSDSAYLLTNLLRFRTCLLTYVRTYLLTCRVLVLLTYSPTYYCRLRRMSTARPRRSCRRRQCTLHRFACPGCSSWEKHSALSKDGLKGPCSPRWQ